MSRSPTVRWSNLPPRREGMWWYRESLDHEASIVRVYRDAGEDWSYQYRDLDLDPEHPRASVNWICNTEPTAAWCYIPEPQEP